MAFRRVLFIAAALLSAFACSLAVGKLDECTGDADCKSRNPALVCQDKMCVVSTVDAGTSADPMAKRCATNLGVQGADSIVLGAMLPFTASAADGGTVVDPRGQARTNTIQLAIDEINQRNGVNSHSFNVVVCDTSGSGDIAKQIATFLIKTYSVPAIISEGSQETISAASVTVAQGVLLLSASATSPEITGMVKKRAGDPAPLVWRVAPSDAIQGAVIANVLKADVPVPTKVAVMEVDDPYGQGLAQVFQTQYGATSPTQAFIFSKDADPTNQVGQADKASPPPTMTLVIGYPNDVGNILNAVPATTNMKNSKWFFTDSAKSATVFAQVKDTSFFKGGVRGTAPASLSGPAFDDFRSRYQSKFSADPNNTSFTAQNYDAAYLLALAAAWAATSNGSQPINGARMGEGLTHVSTGEAHILEPTDFAAARDALEAGKDIDITGASGSLDFDPAVGEAPSKIELWQFVPDPAPGTFSTLKICTITACQ